jgi:hypothetical protein
MKTLIIVLILALVIITSYLVFWRDNNSAVNPGEVEGEQTYCTQDAKLCPDGSYVGRVAPTCEFAECPVSSSTNNGVEAGFDVKL